MSEHITTKPNVPSCSTESGRDKLSGGVAFACVQVLHKVLKDITGKALKLKETREDLEGLIHWIKEHQRGAHQLAIFLRSLGGDQLSFWEGFRANAKHEYGLYPVDLDRILSGKGDCFVPLNREAFEAIYLRDDKPSTPDAA